MTKFDLLQQNVSEDLIDFIQSTLRTDQFEIIPLAGDASVRRYYRVAHQSSSYVLMEWEPFHDVNTYPFFSVLHHFKKHDVHVPEVIAQSPEKGLTLLEDLGDLTLERKFWESQNQNLILPFYKLAIDELIKIHFHCTQDKNPQCSAFQMAFDTDKLLWELNYAQEHLLLGLLKLPLTDQELKGLQKDFLSLCKTLSQEPRYICHRDYHSRNLMLKMGKMRVIDFQDARLGPIQYDLISLIHDSYVNLQEDIQNQILQHYIDNAKKFLGGSWSQTHFLEILELQLIQRCFKACGSFASFFNTREDLRYIHYIQPTLEKVYQAVGRQPQLKAFQSLFEQHQIHKKDYKKICTPSS